MPAQTLNPFSRPVYVMAKPVGAACNLACEYCYYLDKGFQSHGQVMSDEVLEAFVKQYIEAQTTDEVMFTWHGGEPTMAGLDFYRRVLRLQQRYARGRRIYNSLQTNGTLLTDEWCAFLSRHGWLVGISIDGPEQMHDSFRHNRRGASSWARVMRGIQLLRKHGCEWNAMATVNAHNADHPLEFYRFFRDELGCQFLQFTPIVEHEQGHVLPFSVQPAQWGTFLCTLFDEWVQHDVGQVFVQLFDSTLANWAGQLPGVCTMVSTCGHAAVIEANGDVYCCDHFVGPDYLLGNIVKPPYPTLTSLLYSPRQQAFGAAKHDSLPAQCRQCQWHFVCQGECPRTRIPAPATQPAPSSGTSPLAPAAHTEQQGSAPSATQESQPEGNTSYLCEGYRRFFAHVAPAMDFMNRQLDLGLPPADIMNVIASTKA